MNRGVFIARLAGSAADRATAVGGQPLSVQGLFGRSDDSFPLLHGAAPAANAPAALAAVEPFLGGGARGLGGSRRAHRAACG